MNEMDVAASGGGGGMILLIILIINIAIIVGLWKMFSKAGKPGWASIIPIYNAIVMLQIAGKPVWWFILGFIPIVNVIVGIIVCISLAENFGRGIGTALGLVFLPIIFFPMLGFGSAEYQGAAAAPAAPEPAPAPPAE